MALSLRALSRSAGRGRSPIQRVRSTFGAGPVIVLVTACLVAGAARPAYPWPILQADWTSIPWVDTVGDKTPTEVDIVGSATYPAVFYAYDGTNLCFRLRVNGQPGPAGNYTAFNNYVWSVAINTTAGGSPDRPEYGLELVASGPNPAVVLSPGDPTGGGATTWSTVIKYLTPYSPSIATIPNGTYARWSLASDGSLFSGNADYFVDIAMPYQYFLDKTLLARGTPMQVAFATSTDQNNMGKDMPDAGTSWYPSTPISFMPVLTTTPATGGTMAFGYVLVTTNMCYS